MNKHNSSLKSIHYFFDAFSLKQAIKLLDTLLIAAGSASAWQGRYKGDLEYFCENITGLIDAAFTISEARGSELGCKVKGRRKMESRLLTAYETYCGNNKQSTPWDYFPRSLSKGEFDNPIKSVRSFVNFQPSANWKAVVGVLLQSAFETRAADTPEILSIRLHLHKLLEGSHLILVRSAR